MLAIETYPEEFHFIEDSEPFETSWQEGMNPLDYAGTKIGQDIRDFPLPRGHEGAYRYAARLGIVERISENPLYMKKWTEDFFHAIDTSDNALETAISTLRGDDNLDIPMRKRHMPDLTSLDKAQLSDEYKDILFPLVEAYLKYREIGASQPIPDFIAENPGYYVTPDGKRMTSLTGDISTHLSFIDAARQVDISAILKASVLMDRACREYLEGYKNLINNEIGFISSKNELSTDGIYPIIYGDNDVVIAGVGNDTIYDDAGLLIDLGGDDVYLNNAGSSYPHFKGGSVVIDHGGNDRYTSKSSFVQGFGFSGFGFIYDLGGYDSYSAKHFSQGAGILGVGAIFDMTGDDEYSAHAFCQGAGMFGFGGLFDGNGEDIYRCATLGQGGATCLGMGLLSDSSGDDRYELNKGSGWDALGSAGYGQGGALSFRNYPWRNTMTPYGGVGLLFDHGEGNDRYRAGGWNSQGGSYIMSLGALYDEGGNDHYTCNTGQGSGIHVTNAILIDGAGHDIYEGSFRAGGSGSDRSPGFLIDYSGNDVYRSSKASYGTGCKPLNMSLFIDFEGDDTYISPNPKDKVEFNNWESFGGVWPESVPWLWAYAVALDLGGDDQYDVKRRANNSENHSFGHGIHLDIEYSGDLFGEIEDVMPPYNATDRSLWQDSDFADSFERLSSPDNFVRFSTASELMKVEAISDLVAVLSRTEHKPLARDLMEIIDYHLIKDPIPRVIIEEYPKLLKSPIPEIRAIAIDDIGHWQMNEHEEAILNLIDVEEDDYVKSYAISALRRLDSHEGYLRARELAFRNEDDALTRQAAFFVAGHDSTNFELLSKMWESDIPTVKIAAASGFAKLGDQNAKSLLMEGRDTYDQYVRRAAGKALAELGHIEGVEILISTLNFHSIDAFYNYNRNIPNDIATYLGHDLPEEDRYNIEKWQEWLEENRTTVDIAENARLNREYREIDRSASELDDSLGIALLDSFVLENPSYTKAAKSLAKRLNGIAWNMVTADKDSDEFQPELGLLYARRAVELDDQKNYVDTLAEALLANGLIEESLELCRQYPGEKMFTDRINRIKELE